MSSEHVQTTEFEAMIWIQNLDFLTALRVLLDYLSQAWKIVILS